MPWPGPPDLKRSAVRVVAAEATPLWWNYPLTAGNNIRDAEADVKYRNYEISSVDGPVRFRGRKLAQKAGRVEALNGLSVWMKVTVYSGPGGEGFIREDVTVARRTYTFVNMIHPGTSPKWQMPDRFAAATELIDETWKSACRLDEALRPVREWSITSDYEEFEIPAGDGTLFVVRVSK